MPERYFERNKQIIDMADRLIAFNTNKQSGTQNTINTAKKKGIPIMLIGKESV
jgi:predicted Rossmann fold nucleotide-binding protein DprA/Smf involved in DNA uptake